MSALELARGECHCARPGCAVAWARDPCEVSCPDCAAPVGVGCRRPSGHGGGFVELHAARDLTADAAGAYGRCPLGLCGIAHRQVQQDLFA